MLRCATELKRFELRTSEGPLGTLEDVRFDDRAWVVRYLVVNTGSWLNGRRVLIAPQAISLPSWETRVLHVALSRRAVQQSPAIDPQEPVFREHEAALLSHYNWPIYWGTAGFADLAVALPLAPVPAPTQVDADADPASRATHNVPPAVVAEAHRLHSLAALQGHQIEAADGPIGQVADLLIDDLTWEVRYLTVDTRKWLPGKHVLVAPQWIERVGWTGRVVVVDLPRAAIKESPAYDPAEPVTPDYSLRLHAHYRDRR